MAQDDPPQDKDKSTAWAEFRTDLAEDRTIMAMERTYAGWIRTAFAAIGIGLGFRAVFGDFQPPWLARAIATVFILAGAWLALAAADRATKTLAKLHAHEMQDSSPPNFKLLSWCVALGALVLIAGLWFLNDGSLTNG